MKKSFITIALLITTFASSIQAASVTIHNKWNKPIKAKILNEYRDFPTKTINPGDSKYFETGTNSIGRVQFTNESEDVDYTLRLLGKDTINAFTLGATIKFYGPGNAKRIKKKFLFW